MFRDRLHLGNLQFDGDDERSAVASGAHGGRGGGLSDGPAIVAHVADLLGVPADAVAQCLTNIQRKVGREVITSPISPAKAATMRDSLAMALFGRCFEWIVDRINDSLYHGASARVLLCTFHFADGISAMFFVISKKRLRCPQLPVCECAWETWKCSLWMRVCYFTS